ncbi:hypothetical protein [Butyrivibrio sp. JL13D10]|uniref:hypothetical protein n=1 Tax=Butyrivibrio sp. JL13D10 TaxID=3236815 RepID=UPI0038B54E6E
MRINGFNDSYVNSLYQKRADNSDRHNVDSSLSGLGNLGGIQSSIMEKAVMDMEKDSVLHEYQYFVGNKVISSASELSGSRILSNDEDGVVIQLN